MSGIEIGSRLCDAVPENHEEITRHIMDRLRSNGLVGSLPTDLDLLIGDAGMSLLTEDPSKVAAFVADLPLALQRMFRNAKVKTLGAFAFRRKEVYVATREKPLYEVFPKAHEFAHGVLPWHDLSYLDTAATLTPAFEQVREREANFGASQAIFQGRGFRDRVMASDESIASALVIASEYGSTNASALWRYAEVHDRQVALLSYPDKRGNRLVRAVGSSAFCSKRKGLVVPRQINQEHEWFNQRFLDPDIKEGEGYLFCDGARVRVKWESWYNGYNQFVFIAVVSALHAFSQVLQRPIQRASLRTAVSEVHSPRRLILNSGF